MIASSRGMNGVNMKRKLFRTVALALLGVLLSISLVSCMDAPKSAYDVAVDNGFVGTEEQWLASLKGQDLDIMDIYEAAVENGAYTGGDFLTFLTDFLKLDSEMIADAIVKYQEKDTSHVSALPLLSSVSIVCPGSLISGGGKTGSGVILSLEKNAGDAYIITNYHVVMQQNTVNSAPHSAIYVYLYGDAQNTQNAISARYIGGSYSYDIAVLRITDSDRLRDSAAVPVHVEDSETVVAGADAIAIGNAAGLGISVTRGIVSIDSKLVNVAEKAIYQRLIQIDTPVNEGNSGGGLFNSSGKLIGIVSAKMSEDGVENIGYAIPSNIAIRAANRIIKDFESVNTGFTVNPVSLKVARLGIEMSVSGAHAVYDIDRDVTYLTETVEIASVSLGSLAKANGLRAGDILVSIDVDGTTIPIVRDFSFRDALLLCNVNSTVTVTFTRNGVLQSVSFKTPTSEFSTIA